MKIKTLRISHFGKFHDREIGFSDGLNLIEGANESGKTTVHTFLRAMLFGLDKQRGRAAKDDLYTRYQPWDTPGAYQGSMDFEHGGREYRLTRVFYQKEKLCRLSDPVTGTQFPLEDGRITSLIPELTMSAYNNTVSSGQAKLKPDDSLAEEVHNYLANLSTAATDEVDVPGALEKLAAKKKEILKEIGELGIDKLEAERNGLLETERKTTQLLDERTARTAELERQRKLKEEYLCSPEYVGTESIGRIPAQEERLKNLITMRDEIRLQDSRINTDMMIRQRLEQDLGVAEARLNEFEKVVSLKKQEAEVLRNNIKKHSSSGLISGVLMIVSMMIVCVLQWFTEAYRNADILVFRKYGASDLALALSIVFCLLMCVFLTRFVRSFGKKDTSKNRKREDEVFLRDSDRIRTELVNAVTLREAAFKESDSRLAEEQAEAGRRLSRFDRELPALVREITGEDTDGAADEELWELLPTPEELHARYEERLFHRDKVNAVVDSFNDRIRDVSSELERISWELERVGDVGEQLENNKAELERSKEKERELRRSIEAVVLASDTIEKLSDELHDSFGSGINGLLSGHVAQMTGGRYTEARVNRDFEIEVMSGMDYVPASSLSTGTAEQIWLALREAVSDMFFEGIDIPLVLDESFAYSDDDRLRSAMEALSRQENRQILIFACNDRERRMLDELGAEYNLVTL